VLGSWCFATAAEAAGPEVRATWVEDVKTTSAALHAEVSAGGLATTFRFEYDSGAGVEQVSGSAGKEGVVSVSRTVANLRPETTYRYRVVVSNGAGTVVGPTRIMTTRGVGEGLLLDDRGWEMVSPIDKNGGAIQGIGDVVGGGVLQAAAQGGAATLSSVSSFGAGAGAPVGSQYVARRSEAGWAVENVTAPALGGGYGEAPDGVPYQIFSADLGRGLLRGIRDLPLPGTGAPAGYANYYLREAGGGLKALLTQADVASSSLSPGAFQLALVGASPDLGHVVLSTCAALTIDAIEVPGSPGTCDPASPNLYEWSGSGLRLINVLAGNSTGTPPARLGAPLAAISKDGSRVYWTDGANLYLRDGARTLLVGEGGEFQAATPDGALAFFTKEEKLFEDAAASEASVDLTPAGGVRGVLGVSADGSYAYFATASEIFVAHGGGVTPVASAPDAQNFPPSAGTARVSADGARLLFVSRAELTSYDNTDAGTHEPDAEVYLYDAGTGGLTCVSCNPTGERPRGSASIPGAVANGQGETATRAYKPRVLSADGQRVFFDSPDALAPIQDTNQDQDVYEWEAGGAGTCAKPQGCLQLISSGRSAGGASFADASADGADVFFLTDGSLVKADPGGVDLYDARERGGFPEPITPIPCEEDACQPLPPAPDDPSPGTLVPSGGNPPVHFAPARKAKKKHRKHHRKKGRRHRR